MKGDSGLRGRRVSGTLTLGIVFILFPAVSGAIAIPLPLGQTLGAPQRVEEPVTYLVEIPERGDYLIEVQQQGLDFAITVETPDGGVQAYNSPLQRDELELVVLANAEHGTHRITVESKELSRTEGAHAVRVTRLEGDIEQSAAKSALQLMTLGALKDEANKGARVPLASYRQAATLWKSVGDTRRQAHTLYCVAMLEYDPGYQWSAAAESARLAADLYGKLGESALAANATHLRAYALIEQATEQSFDEARQTLDKALRLLEDAHAVQQALGNLHDLGRIKNNIGLTHFYRGDRVQARLAWEESAAALASAGDWMEESKSLQNLAVLANEQGYNASAIESLEIVLQRVPEGKVPAYRAAILGNLAASQRAFGLIEAALGSYSKALDIHRDIGDASGEAYALRGLGNAYYGFGQLDLANTYLQQALPMAEEANDGRNQADVLTLLGNIAYFQGNYAAARDYHESALEKSVSDADRIRREVILARDLIALGMLSEAQKIATDAHKTASEKAMELVAADALYQLGRTQLSAHAPDRAKAYFQRALTVYEAFGLPSQQAETLRGLALASSSDKDAGLEYSEQALARIESLRAQVTAPELRALYSATRRQYYDTHIDLLMAQGGAKDGASEAFSRAALTADERARGRFTLDLLSEANIDLRGSVDPQLAAQQSELYRSLLALRHQRDRLVRGPLQTARQREALDKTLQQMADTETELNLVETGLRERSEIYTRFASPRFLDADEIQGLLDSDSVLLQYFLGDERSFAWAVSRESIHAFELAARTEIERAARQAFEHLQAYPQSKTDADVRAASLQTLAELVLQPAAETLREKRVLVAAAGGLQYIPFTLLSIEAGGELYMLGAKHEVVHIPSMSTVDALRKRGKYRESPKVLAVFADPVFQPDDPRFSTKVEQGASTRAFELVTRASGDELQRLPSTGVEASTIADMVAEDHRLLAKGFDATRTRVLTEALEDYRFIHFATHGLLDARYPALSALALSQFDQDGNFLEGFLRLHDIFGLRLNADLVVLSACDTALGREIRGEGLLGLAQGFLFAGARSLVVSLWQVPDAATAELMGQFYKNILEAEMPPPRALRAAQASVAAQQRWKDPFFWSAFVLLGDWAPTQRVDLTTGLPNEAGETT